MDYTVTTSPDIGSGLGTSVANGKYTVSVSTLEFSTSYAWTVSATDGQHASEKTFTFTTESQPQWWDYRWQCRRKITINPSEVSFDQTNFPVEIEITDSNLAVWAQHDADDFVFTDAQQVKLDHEIELFDYNTGHLVAWVKVPFVSSTAETVLYMYYGNPSAENQQNPTVVWDTNSMLVLHLNELVGPHECRMWGMIANTMPSAVVMSDLVTAPASLKVLGGSNRDGWGLTWYDSTGNHVLRGFPPASEDPNFDLAAEQLANSGGWVGVGHVRARGSGGIPTWGNPHPWMRFKNGQWWAFTHNGVLNIANLKSLIGSAYLAANPPLYGTDWNDAANVVDSDLYELYVLKCIEKNNWNVTAGICEAVTDITKTDTGAANFLLTNGETLWGFRKGNTLWYNYQAALPYYRVASQAPTRHK